MVNEEIIVYRDEWLYGERKLSLHTDRLIIVSKRSFNKKFVEGVALRALLPEVHLLRVRYSLFYWGVVLIGIGILVFPFQVGLAIGSMLVGCMFSLLTFRKLEIASFQSINGKIAVNIFKAGPDKLRFEDVVAVMRTRILACKNTSIPGDPSSSEAISNEASGAK